MYAFPPFSMIWPTISKVTVESEKSVNNGSNMANSDQIYLCIWNSDSTASYCTRLAFIALRHKEMSPSAPETKSTGLTLPRGEEYQLDFQKKDFKKWENFSNKRNANDCLTISRGETFCSLLVASYVLLVARYYLLVARQEILKNFFEVNKKF